VGGHRGLLLTDAAGARILIRIGIGSTVPGGGRTIRPMSPRMPDGDGIDGLGAPR
jgi:hypothetical protein